MKLALIAIGVFSVVNLSAQHSENNSHKNRSVIWSETFTNGIPTDWQNQEQGGIASWEYRGPSTAPNNEVGSRGSCVAEGSVGAVINSPTWTDGFVIFDSNFWDNSDLPCADENMGTGAAPGPHDASLTTPVFDLSSYSAIALKFNQYYKNFNAEMRVDIYTGGIWYTLYSNANAADNSSLDSEVLVPIPSLYLTTNVQFRFHFVGQYYFWQIDDVEIVDVLQNDIRITSATYGDFDFYDPAHPTGYEFTPYTVYPSSMAPLLKFSANGENIGSDIQNAVDLTAVVKNESNEIIHTGTSTEAFDFPSAFSAELRAGTYQMNPVVGNYTVEFLAQQTQIDGNAMNNADTLSFRIDDQVYARDAGSLTGMYMPASDLLNTPVEIGNVFLQSASQTVYATGVSAAFSVASQIGTSVKAILYYFDYNGTMVVSPLAQSSTIILSEEMLNDFGGSEYVFFPFESPQPLQSGMTYFAAIMIEAGSSAATIGKSGATNDFLSWAKFESGETYSLTECPMVRLNVVGEIAVRETEAQQSITLFPNPAENHLQISNLPLHGEVVITDQLGKPIYRNSNLGSTVQAVNTADWSAGIYYVKVLSNGLNFKTVKLIVQ